MLILALESSATAASAALCRDGECIAGYYQNCGLTHSKTLLPMTKNLLDNTGLEISGIDLIAVAHGPGSFTGIRIGVSTAKGLAWAADKPAVGVSTLEAMAWNGVAAPGGAVICCSMDARRNQIYNALFEMRDGAPQRLCGDRAISLEALSAEMRARGGKYYVVGDGAMLCCHRLSGDGIDVMPAPEPVRMQSAWGVAMAAMDKKPGSAHDLLPVYLRLSQAERERLLSLKKTVTEEA